MAVRFASANKRRTTQSWFLVTALHIAVAIGIGFILTRQWGGDPWVTAAFVYGGFLALSLIWWLSTQLVGWLVWRVLWRSAAVNDLVASFQNLKLPKPRSSYAVPSDYFLDIAGVSDRLCRTSSWRADFQCQRADAASRSPNIIAN